MVGPPRTPPAPPPPEARRFTDVASDPGTRVGSEIRIQGEFSALESVEVAGTIDGSVAVDGLCHVHPGAVVSGQITATDVVIEGVVQGSITARGKVELRASARVEADIHAHAVAIAEGSFFDGRVHMEGREGIPTSFREKRQRPPARGPAEKPGP